MGLHSFPAAPPTGLTLGCLLHSRCVVSRPAWICFHKLPPYTNIDLPCPTSLTLLDRNGISLTSTSFCCCAAAILRQPSPNFRLHSIPRRFCRPQTERRLILRLPSSFRTFWQLKAAFCRRAAASYFGPTYNRLLLEYMRKHTSYPVHAVYLRFLLGIPSPTTTSDRHH